jgi:putative transposase
MNYIRRNAYRYHRRSIRLSEYDYSQVGAYFITICSHKHECIFGKIENGKMQLNDLGKIVYNEWQKNAEIRKNISLDSFVVMPNHIHGIIVIDYRIKNQSKCEQYGKPTAHTIPTIIRLFKATTTKQINIMRNTFSQSIWQGNYYEHIIRNETSWHLICEYIENNVLQWELDGYNPNNRSAYYYRMRTRDKNTILNS